MSDTEGFTFVLSVVAIIASFYTAWQQNQLQRRTLALEESREQERLAAQQRAAVRATLSRGMRAATLTILNDGPAEASSIRVQISSEDADADKVVGQSLRQIPVLAAGAHREFPLTTWDGMPVEYWIVVDWLMPNGTPGKWRSHLAMREAYGLLEPPE